jgi:lipoyl(octanoyl) transferase
VIKDINFRDLGLIDYSKAFDLMKNHIQEKDFKDEIWFLEHNPVFTLGTAADTKHILNANKIPVFQSDRGGEVTYHGPGQLVVYFLINVKKYNIGPKEFVSKLQDFVKELLEEYSIKSNFIAGAPGVYINEEKIASIGIRFSKGKSYHGVSINVDMNLQPFYQINPCGYENLSVTQISNYFKKIDIKKVINDSISILKSNI